MGNGILNGGTRYIPDPFGTFDTDIQNSTITNVLISPIFGVMKDSNNRYYFWGKHSQSQLGGPTVVPKNRVTTTAFSYPNYMPLPNDVTSVALGVNTLFATRSGGGIYIWYDTLKHFNKLGVK